MNIYLVFILIACGIFAADGLLAFSLVKLIKRIDMKMREKQKKMRRGAKKGR